MIRQARPDEFQQLTEISFSSKEYWGYPEEYFEIWKDELTITKQYIEKNIVSVLVEKNEILGYFSITELKDTLEVSQVVIPSGFWLEHMFVDPDHIGRGFGTAMFRHGEKICRSRGIQELGILADPNAQGFYEKMGCRYQGEIPSTIPGRTTPWLVWTTSQSRRSD